MVHPAHTSNPTFAALIPGAVASLTLGLAACGSVGLFSEVPGVPRDRASRFDRFVSELDLALTDTAPLLEQVRRGSEGGQGQEVRRGSDVQSANRRDAVRRAVIESGSRRLDREFAPGRLDESRATTSSILIGDLAHLAAQRERAGGRPTTPWSGPLIEAPSVLLREQRRSTIADVDRWEEALRALAAEEGTAVSGPSDSPSARDGAVAASSRVLLEALAGSVGPGGVTDPLLGPLNAAVAQLNGLLLSIVTLDAGRSELGVALQRRYATATSDATIDEVFGASSWEALEGPARERWLAPLQEAAGMEASTERLSTIARSELDRLTLELARAADLVDEGETSPSAARLALRALRSGESTPPGSERPVREPELLWSEARKRLGELIADHPPTPIDAAVAEPFERPFGRWSPFVPGNLAPADDPRARTPLYLAAPPEADFLPRWLREAEAWREGVPGRAVADAYRRSARDVPPMTRRRTREAFEEGWGLYAIGAAVDAGALNEIDRGFGRVAQELCAFAAMLTDLGVYGDGWSREQAAAFLIEVTPLPAVSIDQLVIRSFAQPGRVALPAIGLLRFRALRRGVEAALGDGFDLASFHAALLNGGPVPMSQVDPRIQRWLKRGAPGPR